MQKLTLLLTLTSLVFSFPQNGDILEVSNEETIKEVEDLIKSDPKLPRLTRGEILDILDNITKTDEVSKRREKAVMLVLPYKPEIGGDVQDLYTKPPVTRIVEEDEHGNLKSGTRDGNQNENVVENEIKSTKNWKITTETPKIYVTEVTEISQKSTDVYETTKRRRIPTTTTFPLIKQNDLRFTSKKPNNLRLTSQTSVKPNLTFKSNNLRPTSSKPNDLKFTSSKPNDLRITLRNPIKRPIYEAPKYETTPSWKPMPKIKNVIPPHKPLDNIPLPDEFKDVLTNLDILIKEENLKKTQIHDPQAQGLAQAQDQALAYSHAQSHAQAHTQSQSQTKSQAESQFGQSSGPPNLGNVAETLTPEMQELLMTFGLIPNPKAPQSLQAPPAVKAAKLEPSSEITAESYTAFKPLPDSGSSDESMKEFLSKFGLTDSRKPKSIAVNSKQQSIDLPEDLKDVLVNLGLDKTESTTKRNVMSPKHTNYYASEDELTRLNKLMGFIKQLEKLNGSVSDEDLKHVDLEDLKELVGSFGPNPVLNEQIGPDPVDYFSGGEKNEVKRQQSTTSATPVTEKTNEADLLDSFGGSSDLESQIVTTTTEAPKKTGFYYLVDWNTFLDIDNQKGKRVNLRFQPTIGDPKRFYDVHTP